MRIYVVLLVIVGVWPGQGFADMAKDSPVVFPREGALPAKFSPDLPARCEAGVEEGYYLFRTPERSLLQIAAIQKEMPVGSFELPPTSWERLPKTRRALTTGGDLHIFALGDSIVNDTMRSGWIARLQELYPSARIRGTVLVRGGGGCHHYREEQRLERYVIPRQPDLVLIGGISQKDLESIQVVVRGLRQALPNVEIVLMTGAFGTADPRDQTELNNASWSGTGDYGQKLRTLAEQEHCGFLDLTSPWASYIRSSRLHPHRFYRDAVHANEYGEQVLGRIVLAYFRE